MDYDLNYANQFLGLLVKQAREEKEWDQEYLADELGVDIRTVRKIERNIHTSCTCWKCV